MHTKKIYFFCDLDGTLIKHSKSHKHLFDDKDVAAIKKFQSEGNEFVVATGRAYKRAKMVLDSVGIEADFMICSNGSTIYHKGEKIYELGIDKEDAYEMLSYLHTKNVFCFFANDVTRYINGALPSFILRKILANKFANENVSYDILNKVKEEELVTTIGLLSIFGNKEVKYLKEHFEEKYNFLASGKNTRYHDIVHKKATKGYAIEFLKNYINEPWYKSIAAGDAMNDYHMFEVVDEGYKISDGHEELSKVSHQEIENIWQIFK